ncbi:MAG TPA: SBBP repeat-containing protein, partial [Terriglobia bacterium]|nr:SBBP repeat-containing protein [Terriglobia bacterium]
MGLVVVGLMVFASGRMAPRALEGFPTPKASAHVAANYLNLPLSFVRNRGQVGNDPQREVKFFSAGQGYSLFLTGHQAVLALEKNAGREARSPEGVSISGGTPSARAAVLRMKIADANPHPVLVGMNELPGKNNYFIGKNPGEWHARVPTYAQVKYRDVYPGVDLIFYGNQRHLEFDFVVSPGGNPKSIGFGLAGATKINADAQGNLAVVVGGRTVWFNKPVIFQPVAISKDHPSGKQIVEGGYVLGAGGRVSFRVADYDRERPLVIDPALSYSTYLGGTASDSGAGIAVDSSGNAYVTGSTASTNFPTAAPIASALSGTADAFVAKLDPSGSSLVYSTFLGGNNVDQGSAIAVDSSGDAFVAGTTSSTNFPTTAGAAQTGFAGGQTDAFVARLNPAGDTLAYATYLGGTGNDTAHAIALDSSGDAFVAGDTASTDFPTHAPLQSANGGQGDAFLSEVKPDGSGLVYSTYLGGSGADSAQGVAVDASGNAYLTGYTYSTDFPTLSPYQAANAGSADVFITKFNPAGSALVYSTYLGGTGLDRSTSIAVDTSGNVYVAGETASAAFPTTSGVVQTANHGNGDAFVAKLSANGATLTYSTYLGGAQADQANGIRVDGSGNAFITGYTQSSDFPILNPVEAVFGGGTCGSGPCLDAFVAEINSTATALVYSTYLGGNANDYGQALALDASGNAYVTGAASSSNFPVTAGDFQDAIGSPGGASDVFVAKVNPANAPGAGLSPQSLTFADQATGTTSSPLSVSLSNYGSAALNITSITTSGNFSQTNNCGSSVAAGGASCTINVTFSPTATGALTGKVTINDNAQGSPHTIQLSGNGVAPAPAVGLSPSSLTFADQTVKTASAPQTATLKNTGSATLNITSISTSVADFTETNNCPASLAPNASCTVTVTFTPASSGSVTGDLDVASNVTAGTTAFPLTGTGVAEFTLASNPSSTILDATANTATFTVSLA